MKVIFLDIDGVLNTENYINSLFLENQALGKSKNKVRDNFGHLFDPNAVRYLSALINKHNAKIVISSSWRFGGIDWLKDMWKLRKLPGEIIGITYSQTMGKELFTQHGNEIKKLKENGQPLCRGIEIQAYLNLNPQISNYVIFDDDSDMLKCQKDHFVLCNDFYGLDYKVYAEANSILSDSEL